MAFNTEDGILRKYDDDGAEVVTIPAGVEVIGEYSFSGSENLVRVVIPDGVRKIEQYAFWNCQNLKEVHLPGSLTEIARFAFWECGSLESIRLPQGVRVLGNAAFRECDMLKDVKLPDKMDNIGSSAFSNCISLENIVIPDGIKTVRQRTFYGCLALEKVTLPDGLEEIDEYSFEACRALNGLYIPDSVKVIGRHAFDTCRALADIHIPKGLRNIGSSAFINTELINGAKSDHVIIGNGVLVQYKGSAEEAVVPAEVKVIGERAFSYHRELKSVRLNNGLEEIGDYAFESCMGLEAIVLPDTVTSLGEGAFLSCRSLENAVLSENLTSIGSDVFNDTPLLNTSQDDMFILSDKFLVKYRGSGTDITIPQGITFICGSAFAGCDSLQRLVIPRGVTGIGSNAFEWCRDLQRAEIPADVTFIGRHAFGQCTALNAVIDCGAPKVIGANAFFKGARLTFKTGGRSFDVRLQNDLVSDRSDEEALLAEFAFDPTPEHFSAMSEPRYKLPAALAFRSEGGVYEAYLKKDPKAALAYIIDENDAKMLDDILSSGLLGEDDAAFGIDRAIDNNLEFQMKLMRFKHDNWGGETAPEQKFTL